MHQQEIQAERDRKWKRRGNREESPPAGRVTDETDYFRIAGIQAVIHCERRSGLIDGIIPFRGSHEDASQLLLSLRCGYFSHN
jgi:hypothetical protein